MRHPLSSRILLFVLAVIALVFATGCAATNRETFMRERAAEYVYRRPMAEVFAAAEKLLADEGYTGRESKNSWVFITEWKEDGGGSNISSNYSRYLVEGKELGPNQSLIRITHMVRSTASESTGSADLSGNTHGMSPNIGSKGADADPKEGGGVPSTEGPAGAFNKKAGVASSSRDVAMEWKLLQRLEPQQAKAIEREAYEQYPED
jgi:hypothetical protein